ncbi:MAG: hypothetical protein DRP38_01810 [Thermotogae bacterium]|nr:MAG: hypothetical protein DRP38_01810 [Thermotogota bacterium]
MSGLRQITVLAVIILGFFFVMMGLWAIDIGVSGMVSGFSVTNGWDWGTRTAVQQYHIGLWLVGIGTLLSVMSSLFSIIEWKNE